MHNVRDYGARGDGVTPDTQAIQRAIDACGAGGGGTVLLPAGRYLSGTLRLVSSLHFQLEAGAVLLGSTDLDHDFLPDEKVSHPLYQDTSHSFFQHSPLWGEGDFPQGVPERGHLGHHGEQRHRYGGVPGRLRYCAHFGGGHRHPHRRHQPGLLPGRGHHGVHRPVRGRRHCSQVELHLEPGANHRGLGHHQLGGLESVQR